MVTTFTPQGTEVVINTTTELSQNDTAIATLSDGSYIVTWTSEIINIAAVAYEILSQRYAADGTPMGGEVKVDLGYSLFETSSSVTGLVGGGYVVTWTKYSNALDSEDIFMRQYDAAGLPLSGEVLVNIGTDREQNDSQVTALAGGGFAIVWNSVNRSTTANFQIFSAAGVPASPTDFSVVGSISTNYNTFPVITELSNGNIVVSTVETVVNEGRVVYEIYSPAGAQIKSTTIVPGNFIATTDPSIIALDDGGFLIGWTTKGVTQIVHAHRFDAAGNPIGGLIEVPTGNNNNADVAAASLADGGYVLVWTASPDIAASPDGSGTTIMGLRFDAAGAQIGDPIQINTNIGGDQTEPDVVALDNGGFVVSWTSDGVDGSGLGVSIQTFAPQTFGTAAADTINGTSGNDWIFGGQGADTLNGGEGRDVIYGSAGEDIIDGGIMRDKLFGGRQNDTVNGGLGNDLLNGGNGRDTLNGDGGKDVLIGGAGGDTLTGGIGADVFLYRNAAESGLSGQSDAITDFEVGLDHIDLSAMALTFLGNAAFAIGTNGVRVSDNGTDTFVRVDTNGDGIVDMRIILEGVISLTADDFVL